MASGPLLKAGSMAELGAIAWRRCRSRRCGGSEVEHIHVVIVGDAYDAPDIISGGGEVAGRVHGGGHGDGGLVERGEEGERHEREKWERQGERANPRAPGIVLSNRGPVR